LSLIAAFLSITSKRTQNTSVKQPIVQRHEGEDWSVAKDYVRSLQNLMAD
jgi:hypothetical protein